MFEAELRLFQEEGITLDLPNSTKNDYATPSAVSTAASTSISTSSATTMAGAEQHADGNGSGRDGSSGSSNPLPHQELKFEFPDSTECMGVLQRILKSLEEVR